jgi:uncharacterized protein (TIGR03067 family)
MTKWVLTAAFMAVAPLGLCHAGDRPKGKFAELEGTWTIVKMEIDGRSLLEKGEKWKLVIKAGKVTASADGKNVQKGSLELSKILDPGKKPKTVTVPYEGRVTFYGIYEVRGDRLLVCGDAVDPADEKNPEGRRPKKFDSKQGLLLVFKRSKK